MLVRRQHGAVTWIDLESPNHAEVRKVASEFHIDPSIANELMLPSIKARAELHPSYVYAIFHFPALRHTHTSIAQEIDFVVGNQFLITTHYDTIDPLHTFSKSLEVQAALHKSGETMHGGHIFFALMEKLYRSVEHEIDAVRQDLRSIEENIFSGYEVPMVAAISRSARSLLNLRQTIEPHREMLRTLEEESHALFGQEFTPYARTLSSEYYRVHNHVMRHTDTLHELRETNNSLLTTKQSHIMKTFTVLAFFTLPLSLIASIFSMNTHSTPIVGGEHDFLIIVIAMTVVTGLMIWYFRRKKWL